MSRYIEKEKVYTAIDIVRNYCIEHGMHFETTLLEMAMNEVGHIPTADVVEVVRCKDCKHAEIPLNGFFGDNGKRICVRLGKLYLPCEFYCKYGERKEENEG